MKKTPLLFASALALTCASLLGPLHGGAPPQDSSITLAQRANEALGLTHSVVANSLAIADAGEALVVSLDLPGAPTLNLRQHSVRADSFEVRAQVEGGSWMVMPPEPVRTYRGTVENAPDSLVAASMLEDGLHARIRVSGGEEYWIEPLAGHVPQARSGQHVLYRSADVIDTGKTCGAGFMAPVTAPGGGNTPNADRQGMYGAGGMVTAEIACDADFEYFSDHGTGTQARIESVINTLNLQYSSEVGITHQITDILIRTTSNDPYSRKKADQLLNEFRNEWNNNQGSIQRDVAHLFTGKDLSGSTIGVAYIAQVCNLPLAYGLVESDFNSNFACVTDLSAHELGHNWGANHCSCSGFTMNASITCANTFSPSATRPEIIAYRDAQSCFGPPPATGSVAGTVTSSAGGAAISGASVSVDSGQSTTTAGNGTYTISGVPVGTRTVSASAPGFDPANANANVVENQTTTVNFSLDPAPVGSQAIVECITYRSSGGQNQDRNLFIDVLITDDGGNPVSGASVSVAVDLDGSPFGTATATTDSNGEVTLQAKNSPNGCFETDVTNVSAAGLTFDGTEPLNGFAKGSDASPDPDCRGSSDGCGAG